MESTSKPTDTTLQVHSFGNDDLRPQRKYEDAAVEKLGHQATLPRTLTSRLGLIGTISAVVCPWPTALSVAPLCLSNGGTGGLVVGFVVSAVFMGLVYYLLAKKVQMTPTAGGQYHMVLQLAPPKARRFLSYMCGFALCFTWESFLAAAAWLFGLNVSATVTLWRGEYKVWYTFVPTICMLAVACAANLSWGNHMNLVEGLVILVQFGAFLLVVVLLAFASGTHTLTASLTFTTTTGWPDWVGAMLALSYCTGILGGFDCALHLAEDTEDAAMEIPKTLMLSTTVNSLTCVFISILVTLCAGDPDLLTGDLALSGHPLAFIIQLLFDAARERREPATAVFVLCAILFGVCTINTTTTSSRMLFSLVRDGRDPYITKILAKDFENKGLPRRCVVVASTLPAVILWINFVSAVGYSAIVSQVAMSLVITYFLVCACSLDCSIRRPELLPRKRGGFWYPSRSTEMVLDIIAMVFLLIVGVLCCLPFAPFPNAAGWNYAPFMVLGVLLLAIMSWYASARKHYRPGSESVLQHDP